QYLVSEMWDIGGLGSASLGLSKRRGDVEVSGPGNQATIQDRSTIAARSARSSAMPAPLRALVTAIDGCAAGRRSSWIARRARLVSNSSAFKASALVMTIW